MIIPAGDNSIDVFVDPIDDPDIEETETVVLSVSFANLLQQALSVDPSANEATINILDDDAVDLADLTIAVSNNADSLEDGEPVTYIIEVNNIGTTDVAMATVNGGLPLGGLTAINWTCIAGIGASCAASGAGNISDTISLDAGTIVTYTLTATVNANPGENVQLEITVTADGDTPDKASDIDPVRLWFRNGFE